MRTKIERGLVTDSERAERQWLILALATLRLTAIGASSEDRPERSLQRRFGSATTAHSPATWDGRDAAPLVLAVTWPQGSFCHH